MSSTLLANAWTLRPGVTYLNHGSWGPTPRPVASVRADWLRRIEEQPHDFFVRQLEPALEESAARLGQFVGADSRDLVFVPNATFAMNLVAENMELKSGDEVLANNHEYGAVLRIWRDACAKSGAKLVVQPLPNRCDNPDLVADAVMAGATSRTRLVVVSHVTSPSALILPVEKICRRARQLSIPVCIDGPHAVAMQSLNIREIGCDFYCASLHKWLSAPYGSGFLYLKRRYQQGFRPVVTSWGGSLAGRPQSWKDELTWGGTHDPTPFLAAPAAIDFLESCGLNRFRKESRDLAAFAAAEVGRLTGLDPFIPLDGPSFGSMVAVPLPKLEQFEPKHGHADPLQSRLWNEHQIEVPVMHCAGQRLLRISCHLYNAADDIDRLITALRSLL